MGQSVSKPTVDSRQPLVTHKEMKVFFNIIDFLKNKSASLLNFLRNLATAGAISRLASFKLPNGSSAGIAVRAETQIVQISKETENSTWNLKGLFINIRWPVNYSIFYWLLCLIFLGVGGRLTFLAWSNFVSKSVKPEDLVQKGNQLKAVQSWSEAGSAFESAAEQFSKQRRGELDAANNYSEAANCYRKLPANRPEAVRCLQRAAEIYAEQGQFSIAARHLEEAGDLATALNKNEAIELYQRAADYWSGEDSPASAAGSRAKAAELMADCGRLTEAARLFEDLGVSAESHSLLGFGAKDHLAKCCLCLLCSEASAGVGEKAEQLAGVCGSFKDTDELTLVKSLAAAADARDVGGLDAAVSEFERFNNVDDFSRRRLEQLRKFVASGGVMLR